MNKAQNVALNEIESVMRRVKRALYWHGSRDTSDFVQGLVEKWIRSDEYVRLSQANPDDISVFQSARAYVIDHLRRRDALKRRGGTVPLEAATRIPAHDHIESLVAEAEALQFVREEVGRLEQGLIREDSKHLLLEPEQTAVVMRRTMEGASNAEISHELDVSAGLVSKRLQAGCAYMAKQLLQHPRQR